MKKKWWLFWALLLAFANIAAADSWYVASDGSNARYRVPVTVTLEGSALEADFPVEQYLDFAALVDLGAEQLDPNSIIVVDQATGIQAPSLFLADAPGSSAGKVMWQAVGSLSDARPRVFYVYFDTTAQEAAPPKELASNYGIFLEAEAADKRHVSYAIGDAPQTSGGKTLFAGPGGNTSLDFFWEYSAVEIPLTGTYNIYARVGGNKNKHKFGLSIDGVASGNVEYQGQGGWQWVCQPNKNITAGKHKFAFSLTDATDVSLKADLVVITNYDFSPQTGFINTAVGNMEMGTQFLPISQWLTTGTFPGIDFAEEPLDPEEIWPVENGVSNGVRWGSLVGNPDGSVTIPGEAGLGYAHVYLHSAKTRQLQLEVSSTSSCAIYLNGVGVYSSTGPGVEAVSVQLNQGWNRLLVKNHQQPGGKVALNVVTAEGKLPRDVYLSLNDPLHLHVVNLETSSTGFAPGGWYPEYVLQFAVTRQALISAQVFSTDLQVKELCLNRLVPAGKVSLRWDGTDASGKTVANGDYIVIITATDFVNSADVEVVEVPVQVLIKSMPSLRTKMPVAEAVLVETTPLFSWEQLAEAKSYILQYSQDPKFVTGVGQEALTGTEYQLTSQLSPGTWYWRVIGIDEYGNAGYSPIQTFTLSSLESATGNQPFGVFQLRVGPNPFTPNGDGTRDQAVISFVFATDGGSQLTAQIYNLSGHLVRTLVQEQLPESGEQRLFWDGRDQKGNLAPSGLYFVWVRAADQLGENKTTLKAPVVLVR